MQQSCSHSILAACLACSQLNPLDLLHAAVIVALLHIHHDYSLCSGRGDKRSRVGDPPSEQASHSTAGPAAQTVPSNIDNNLEHTDALSTLPNSQYAAVTTPAHLHGGQHGEASADITPAQVSLISLQT